MSEFKVTFLPYKRVITGQEWENLIWAAMKAGVHVNTSYRGEGVCGKCRVIIVVGVLEGGNSDQLSEEVLTKGNRF